MFDTELDALDKRVRHGDTRAFGQLIRMLDTDLRGVAWSVLRDVDATDDAMQSAYERAFRSLERFDGRSSVKTWLFTICYRTSMDLSQDRGRRSHDGLDDQGELHHQGSTEGAAIDRTELAAVMDQLKPDQRALLMLTAGLGYSFDEVSAIVGIPRGTVASRVGRARQALQRWEPV